VQELRYLLQSIAMLDAIICPEWQYRYYSFNAKWSAYEQMGSMRDGSGDDFFALFNKAGCWLKGFSHEAPMAPYSNTPARLWPGVIDSVPLDFAECLREPAFKIKDTTFCVWRQNKDAAWQRGEIVFPDGHEDPDGSEALLSPLDGQPETYRGWAVGYYERDISLRAVKHIYQHEPLNAPVIADLNSDVTLRDLHTDIEEIDYPVS
jgi:hypothetical protein